MGMHMSMRWLKTQRCLKALWVTTPITARTILTIRPTTRLTPGALWDRGFPIGSQ